MTRKRRASERGLVARGRVLAALAALAGIAGCRDPAPPAPGTLTVQVSEPLVEFHTAFAASFTHYWEKHTRQQVEVTVLPWRPADGAPTGDVWHAPAAAAVGPLVTARQVRAEWPWRFPHGATPFRSAVVFVTAAGNPKGIRAWADLARTDVGVAMADAAAEPAATWERNAAAAAGLAGSAEHRVSSLSSYAFPGRDGRLGADVVVTWENVAGRWAAGAASGRVEVVYPSPAAPIEPPVVVLDGSANAHNAAEIAQGYVEYLFARSGQDLAARHRLRPRLAPKNPDGYLTLPDLRLGGED